MFLCWCHEITRGRSVTQAFFVAHSKIYFSQSTRRPLHRAPSQSTFKSLDMEINGINYDLDHAALSTVPCAPGRRPCMQFQCPDAAVADGIHCARHRIARKVWTNPVPVFGGAETE